MSAKLTIGDEAPDFTLPSLTGDRVTLSQYRGKNVVLYFYPKDETRGCTAEACGFRDSYTAFTELNAEVIGISSDSVEDHKSFAQHHKLPFVLLSDEGKKIRNLYGVSSFAGLIPGRVTFIIDKNGIIRHIFSSQLKISRHIQESIEVLKRLTAENPPETSEPKTAA